MTAIVSVGDLNGDGNPDVVARKADGTLWLYPGNGSNGFGTPTQLAPTVDWAGMTAIEGVADFNGDGHVDLVARDSTGAVWLYPFTGAAVIGTPMQLTERPRRSTSRPSRPSSVSATSTTTATSDLLVRDTAGVLWLLPGNGSGGLGTPVKVGNRLAGLFDRRRRRFQSRR